MAQLLNLTLTDFNKFIVVDEGIDATYSRHLIIACLQTIRKKKIDTPITILLFSTPKASLDNVLDYSELDNYHVQDYFNVNVDDEGADVYQELTNFVAQHSDSILVLDCLGTLALQIGTSKACAFVEKLSKNHKSEVFCIYRRDFYQVFPRIESLGNVYVKLKKSKKVNFGSQIHYEISVTQKKTQSVARWNELIQQNIENYDVHSEKIPNVPSVKLDLNMCQKTVKPESSFRLEMSEKEMQQRDSVPLPYILSGNPERESKIFYLPDDFDDEDPDEDLDI